MTTQNSNEQLEFISRSSLLEEGKTPGLVKNIILIVTLIVVAFILWSASASVREIALTDGSIIPSGRVQVVQHQDGGTIQDIKVADGQLVEAGEEVVVLSGQDTKDDKSRLEYKLVDLYLNAERLKAFTENREPAFDKIVGSSEAMIRNQENMLGAMQQSDVDEASVLQDQLKQKQDYINVLNAKISSVRKNLNISQEIYNNNKNLFEKKLITKSRFLASKSEYNQLVGEKESLQAERDLAKINVNEYKNRLKSQDNQVKKDALQELGKIESQILETQKLVEKAQNQVSRLVLTAPVKGIVKGMEFNTIGAVVKPGEKILEIVPTDRKLVAEIKISPNDIGHVEIGQPARVKVTSYDFTRYGDITGKVSSYSATTFTDDKGNSFYKGLVELDKNYVGQDSDKNVILPGMVVSAEVITGRKTVLQYLLKPVQLAMGKALTEK